MAKSPEAFRTIGEVSDWLDTPAHVLRFWESKFIQIKPVKRAGGRRYYRPQDMALLGGIKKLLHEEGMTIKGTQKLLREKGIKYVSTIGPSPHSYLNEEIAEPISQNMPSEFHKEPPESEIEAAIDAAEDEVQFELFEHTKITEETNVVSLHQKDVSPGPLASALAEIKPDPKDTDFASESRFYAGYFQTTPEKLTSHASALAPLVERLEAVKERLTDL